MSFYQSEGGASMYQQISLPQQIEFRRILSMVQVEKGWKVLDVGCGTGNCTVILSEMVGDTGKVVGVDPIESRIQQAKETCQRDNIQYFKAPGQDAWKFGEDFDLVVIGTVFHWIPFEQQDQFFQSLKRALKPNGLIIFNSMVEAKMEKDQKLLSLLADDKLVLELRSNVFFRTREQLREVASKHGFQTEEMTEENIKTPFDSLDMLFQHFAASCHVVDYDVFLEKLRSLGNKDRTVLSFLKDEDGKYLCDNTYNFVKWRKM